MATLVEDILRRTSSLVNAAEGVSVSDQAIKPHVVGAHWAVINSLSSMGSTDLIYRTEFTIVASTSGVLISPSLPTNIIVPIRLWEKGATDDEWLDMQSVDGLPNNRPIQSRLTFWDWRNQQLWLPEVDQDVLVRMDYRGGPIDLTMPQDSVEVLGLSEPIAWQAAASMCSAMGDVNRATIFEKKAKDFLTLVATQNTRMRQQRPVKRNRRRPGIPLWR